MSDSILKHMIGQNKGKLKTVQEMSEAEQAYFMMEGDQAIEALTNRYRKNPEALRYIALKLNAHTQPKEAPPMEQPRDDQGRYQSNGLFGDGDTN